VTIYVCLPQNTHELPWDWTWVSTMKGRQLSACVIAHSKMLYNIELKMTRWLWIQKIIYCHALSDRRRVIGLTIGFITHNRTLKYNTTESLRTPSVRSHCNRCSLGNRRTPGSLPSVDTKSPTQLSNNSEDSPNSLNSLRRPNSGTNSTPRYMTSGRTVEETVLLALVV
jgi:hypothetical protein